MLLLAVIGVRVLRLGGQVRVVALVAVVVGVIGLVVVLRLVRWVGATAKGRGRAGNITS